MRVDEYFTSGLCSRYGVLSEKYYYYFNDIIVGVETKHSCLLLFTVILLRIEGCSNVETSMTSILTHNVAHSTRHSFTSKTNNQPIKKYIPIPNEEHKRKAKLLPVYQAPLSRETLITLFLTSSWDLLPLNKDFFLHKVSSVCQLEKKYRISANSFCRI